MEAPEVKKPVPRAKKPEGFDDQWRPVRVLAVDGKRAVEMFKMLRPDIVTLDVEMPFMDGFEALGQNLRVDPNAVVAMLTNQKEKYTVDRIIKAGAKEYIVKPINRQLILAKLRKIRGIPDYRR
jgi:two-component system chemotaxis response regulator CheY